MILVANQNFRAIFLLESFNLCHLLMHHGNPSPWIRIDLPLSSSSDIILIVGDCFTKIVHFSPCTKDFTSEDIAQVLFQEVFLSS